MVTEVPQGSVLGPLLFITGSHHPSTLKYIKRFILKRQTSTGHWGSSGVPQYLDPFSQGSVLGPLLFITGSHHTSTLKYIKRFILKRQTSTGHWGSSGVPQYLDPFSFPHTLHHWVHHTSTLKYIKRLILKRQTSNGHWGSSGVSSWTPSLLHIHFHHWVPSYKHIKIHKAIHLKEANINWSLGFLGGSSVLGPLLSGVSSWTPSLHHWVPSYKHINIHKVIHLKEDNINWSLGFLRGQYLDPSSSPHTLHHWGSSGIGSWTPSLLHIHFHHWVPSYKHIRKELKQKVSLRARPLSVF